MSILKEIKSASKTRYRFVLNDVKLDKDECKRIDYVLKNGVNSDELFIHMLSKTNLPKLVKEQRKVEKYSYKTGSVVLDSEQVFALKELNKLGLSNAELFKIMLKKTNIKALESEIIKLKNRENTSNSDDYGEENADESDDIFEENVAQMPLKNETIVPSNSQIN